MKTSCIVGALLLGLLVLSAGASGVARQSDGAAATPAHGQAAHAQSFDDWVTTTLVDKVKADPKYHRIPLDTRPAAEEFGAWMQAMWSQQITPREFKQEVGQKYPGHDYEVDFIIANMPPVSQRLMQ